MFTLDQRIDIKLDQRLTKMEDSIVNRLTTVIEDKIGQKIDELATMTAHGFEEVHTRIDGLETKVDGLEVRMNGVETRLTNIEGRLTNIEEFVRPA